MVCSWWKLEVADFGGLYVRDFRYMLWGIRAEEFSSVQPTNQQDDGDTNETTEKSEIPKVPDPENGRGVFGGGQDEIFLVLVFICGFVFFS